MAQTRSSLLRSDASAIGENPTLGGQGQYRRSSPGAVRLAGPAPNYGPEDSSLAACQITPKR